MRKETAGDRGSEVKAWASLESGSRAAEAARGRAQDRERPDCRHHTIHGGRRETTGHSCREGKAHEGQTQLHPNNPQHPSGQTRSLIQPGLSLGKTGRGQEGSCLNPRGQAPTAWLQLGICGSEGQQEKEQQGDGVCWWWGHPSGRLASVLGPEKPGGGTHLA